MNELNNSDLVHKYYQESDIVIQGLYEKYKNDPYMLSKLRHLLCNQLSNMLDNISKTHEANEVRFEEMSIEKDAFVETFLNNNNKYLYNSSTENFFLYDSMHYKNITEDDLLYTILSTISQSRQLMSWKQRTRMNIMKRIKDTPILKSVPESDTIQFVLDLLYPAFFESKTKAKYFLCILGDSLLKKETNLIHFIKPISKNFIQYLNEQSNQYIGINLNNSFKYKYHEHDYVNCRMVLVNESIKNETLWKSILQNHALDIICVASHYSTRYVSSDEFIIKYNNNLELYNSIFYLQERTHLDMVKQFVSAYLQLPRSRSGSGELSNISFNNDLVGEITTTSTIIMSWKNMHFLWKHYLVSLNLSAIMFQQTLKQLLTEYLKDYYFQDSDLFKGIFSKYLPSIQQFIQFFDETIVEDGMETDFEIDELLWVFKFWLTKKNESNSQLSDCQILDIIRYYYPNIMVDQDKFIHHIRCTLWDKQMDIQIAIDDMHNNLHNQNLITLTMFQNEIPNEIPNTSIYDMYIYYCKYYNNLYAETLVVQNYLVRPGFIVSKSYFDKYIMDRYAEYVVDVNMLSGQWTM